MAICTACEREMFTSDGCINLRVPTVDGPMDRIIYGEEVNQPEPVPGKSQHGVLLEDPPRCHDCSALPGHYHHQECDWEECPRCHEQLIGCFCIPDEVLGITK